MRILLRSHFYKIFGGTENIGGGLISATENQRKMLKHLNISFTENINDDWDVIQINIPWPEALKEAKLARKNGKKVVMWSHVTVEDLEKSVRIFKIIPGLSFLIKKYLKYAYGHADLIFCPSQYTKNLLINYGLPSEKLFAQSNAIDTDNYYKDITRRELYRKQYNLSGLVVGNVSLVIPRKGIDTFILLSKKFTKNQFVWFGKIFNKLFVAGLPKTSHTNIYFTDFIQDAVAALNAIDIFLFPSYEENQGMVVLEAAAIGLPILVRDIPVYEGWLVHNVNCLKAKDESEFEVCLNNLLEDNELRDKLGKNALLLAEKESIKSQGILVQKAYDSLFK
ncbi:MAG: glycosyltransferase family 4 protein [Candidatus Zambryskibacteria bacterium]|nr:glycosyltransferase family 4 protein [Candidatus Zambryskibacteria bacterium]